MSWTRLQDQRPDEHAQPDIDIEAVFAMDIDRYRSQIKRTQIFDIAVDQPNLFLAVAKDGWQEGWVAWYLLISDELLNG